MNLDYRKTVEYWKEGSKYDLGVARALVKSRKYPYALFFGHLSVEKMLKALVVAHTRQHAPFTHSVTMLAEKNRLVFPA
jgi:HEPN domain-containing protein